MGKDLIAGAARELRQRQTEAERVLWFKLRDNQVLGTKFRRQEPIGNFIVDFVNFENKLVIEVDGSHHKEIEVRKNDVQRTSWLKSEGFRILRFWDSDILDHLETVVKKIKGYL